MIVPSTTKETKILFLVTMAHDHAILSAVYEETISIRTQIDNQIMFLKNMTLLPFAPTGQMRLEYAKLRSKYGKGESACMAFCRFTHNVIGSSNLRDIKDYCAAQKITYLTTLDFLYYAFVRGIMTKVECNDFIRDVNANGSKLPVIDITLYSPNARI